MAASAARPVQERPAEMELRARVARMRGDETLQRVEAVRRPAGECGRDLRVDGVVALEDGERRLALALAEQRLAAAECDRLRIAADAEVERERRHARPRLRHRARALGRLATRLEPGNRHGPRDGERGRSRNDREHACTAGHRAPA